MTEQTITEETCGVCGGVFAQDTPGQDVCEPCSRAAQSSPTTAARVWVVTPLSSYLHGARGVYATREAAVEANPGDWQPGTLDMEGTWSREGEDPLFMCPMTVHGAPESPAAVPLEAVVDGLGDRWEVEARVRSLLGLDADADVDDVQVVRR